MKGSIVCPSCKENFSIDLPEDAEKHKVSCPNCQYEFNVKPVCRNKSSDDCSWEEYGEPRKTILSSIKPETKKPFIAIFLLIIIFSIGVTTAVFSEAFIETSLDLSSSMGFTGEIKLHVTDYNNRSLEEVNILLNEKTIEHQSSGKYYLKDIEPGVQTIQLSDDDFKTQKIELLILPFITTEENIQMHAGTGEAETIYFNSMGCSAIIIIFSIFALLSMIACIKRQHCDLAIVGSFLAIFSFGFYFIGSILSIVAFVLIILSRDEFENGKTGKIF